MGHCAVYRSFTPYSARDDNPVKNIGKTNRLSREKLCFYGGCTLVVRMHIKIRDIIEGLIFLGNIKIRDINQIIEGYKSYNRGGQATRPAVGTR
jgi:hypothetical protein